MNTVLPFQTPAGTRGHRDSHEKESLLTKRGPFEPHFFKLPIWHTESIWADTVSSRTELERLESAFIWVIGRQVVYRCVMSLSSRERHWYLLSMKRCLESLLYVLFCLLSQQLLDCTVQIVSHQDWDFIAVGDVQSLSSKINIWNILRDVILWVFALEIYPISKPSFPTLTNALEIYPISKPSFPTLTKFLVKLSLTFFDSKNNQSQKRARKTH